MADDPLIRAIRAHRRAQEALNARQAALYDEIADAVNVRGVRQSEVVKLTGYTREHIRRICRERSDPTP